ncbi:MAG TPA: hypothetical protein VLK65_02345 [Vicinamibacteria bacterium]|nr:hypothetical protein [Vicinamibacteria bacterium]
MSLLLSVSPSAFGQGGQDFRLSDLKLDFTLFSASIGSGARALAMGGSFIAIADDGTAASWNPAGLGVLEEAELSLNWQPLLDENLTKPSTRVVAALPVLGAEPLFGDTGETRLERSGKTVDFVSFAMPTRFKGRKLVPQFSYQRVIPSLDAYFEGGRSVFVTACAIDCREQTAFESSAFLEASGGIDVYAGSLGIDFGERLLVGASLNWWRGDSTTRLVDTTTELSSGRDFRDDDAEETETRFFNTFERTETLSGFSVNLGAIVTPAHWARVGVVFKTPFHMRRVFQERFEASELTRNLNEPPPLSWRATFSESTTTSEGDIDWPATLGVGFAWLPASVATISTDFTWTNWSEARTIEESTTTTSNLESTSSQIESSYPAPNQVDAWQYRLGAELVVIQPSFAKLAAIPLRGGFFLDRQYFLDFQSNRSLNRGFSAGVGLVWRRFTLDIAYVHTFGEREPAARVQELPLGVVPGTDGTFGAFKQEGGKAHFSSHQVLVSTIVRF